jgi:hypothetical protein
MLLRRTLLAAPLCVLAVAAASGLGGCLATRGASVPAGQIAPGFQLKSHEGRDVSLDGLVAQGPAVLIFYRGYW